MKDMLGQNLLVGDLVAYVYPNVNGKTSTIAGKVVAIGKARCKVETVKGIYIVSNVIKLERKIVQKVVNQQVINKIGLLEMLKNVFKK